MMKWPAVFRHHTGSTPRFGSHCLAIVWLVSLQAQADTTANPPPADNGNPRSSILAPSVLDGGQPVIGSIIVRNGNVFDIDRPDESGLFYRLVNKAHIKTKPDVINQQLLFAEGETLSRNAVEESERILRSNRYIQDASIETAQRDDGIVDVYVDTVDSWTLIPKVSLSRSGGENNSGIGLREMNLLGTGMEVEALYKSDVDRDAFIFKFLDRNLLDSWYSLAVVYADNSDGHTKLLDIAMPFYSLDSTTAHGLSILDNDQVDSLYQDGEIVGRYRHEAQKFEIFHGWSRGLENGWTKRYTTGLAYDEHLFSQLDENPSPANLVPEDRLLAYPFVGFEMLENRYEETRNLEQINRTEDRYLGTRLNARLGYAAPAFGSDRAAWIVEAGAQTAFGSTANRSLFLSSAFATRIEDTGVQNALLDLGARYYRRHSDRRLFYVSLDARFGHRLDNDNQLLLGGDNGLRGYPLRYRNGNRSALLTIEQRYFTDWYPFRLFRVGGAVFFDAGRTWDSRLPSARSGELLRDVGFGLRLANTRSGQNRMTHIDIAFPLDGDGGIDDVQLLIETRKSF